MPDPLSELLHRSVDDVAVPHPSAYDILGRGRGLRRRRRIMSGVVAAAAVIAVGVGGVVLADLGGESRGNHDVTDHVDEVDAGTAQQAYDERGAWTADGTVTIGQTTVELPGVVHLAQTSVGVVAQIRDDEGGSAFVLVRPDGSRDELSIPTDVQHVEGDLNAARVVWLEPDIDVLEVHVWDVVADEEVGSTGQPLQGDRVDGGNQFLPVALLDGDLAHFDAGNGTSFQVNWRTNGATAVDQQPFSVHRGVATVMDGTDWMIRDVDSNTVVRRLAGGIFNPTVSPDGSLVLLVDTSGDVPVASVQAVSGGRRTTLPDVGGVAVWTRAGNVLSAVAGGVQICRADGTCEQQSVEATEGSVLLADYLNVG